MHQHIKETTRQRGDDRPSRLDLVFTNDEFLIGDIEQQSPLGKSDHDTLVFSINCQHSTIREIKRRRLYQKAKVNDMYEELEGTNWGGVLQIEQNDMDTITDHFLNHME